MEPQSLWTKPAQRGGAANSFWEAKRDGSPVLLDILQFESQHIWGGLTGRFSVGNTCKRGQVFQSLDV